MPYPTGFHRLQVSGTGVTGEIFSWSLSLRHVTDTGAIEQGNAAPPVETHVPGSNETGNGVPDEIMDAITTMWSQTSISSTAKIHSVKLNLIDTHGHYADPITSERMVVPPLPGGGGAANFPPQVSVCVSLLSGLRGQRYRGRIFLPYPALALQDIGRWSANDCDTLALYVARMLSTMGQHSWFPVVASAAGPSGNFALITEVRVGDRPDIIRSRGGALLETYHARPVSF